MAELQKIGIEFSADYLGAIDSDDVGDDGLVEEINGLSRPRIHRVGNMEEMKGNLITCPLIGSFTDEVAFMDTGCNRIITDYDTFKEMGIGNFIYWYDEVEIGFTCREAEKLLGYARVKMQLHKDLPIKEYLMAIMDARPIQKRNGQLPRFFLSAEATNEITKAMVSVYIKAC